MTFTSGYVARDLIGCDNFFEEFITHERSDLGFVMENWERNYDFEYKLGVVDIIFRQIICPLSHASLEIKI